VILNRLKGEFKELNKLRKLKNATLSNYHFLRLKKDQWKDPQQLQDTQFKKLKAILNHAYNYVPYYHKLFSVAEIKPDDIKHFKDLNKIPLTSKQNIKRNFSNILALGIDPLKLPSGKTSGSTGIPMKIVYDYPTKIHHNALHKYLLSECGVKLNDNFITIWGRDAKSITWGKKYSMLFGDVCNTVIPLVIPEKIIKVLRKLNPDVINTFPSVITTLANYDISGINPRIIFTMGEIVTKHHRDLVKTVFNSELFETYGSVEFEHLAFECKEHCGLHTITDGAYIEFIDENGEYVSAGESGEIIVTGLINYAMPLIRYRIGDLGIPTDEKCPCGRSWQLIKSIEGRSNDYLTLPSGKILSFLYLMRLITHTEIFSRNIFNISQYQIVQEQKDKITFNIVKGKNFNLNDFILIKNNIKNWAFKLGENLNVEIKIVDKIQRTRTGKRKVLISMLE